MKTVVLETIERTSGMTNNQKAFLDMIACSEIGPKLLAVSDNGYNVIVGSTAEKPILFDNYATHPHRLVKLKYGINSTAAGRYQLLARYYESYRKTLHLTDFSPASQDTIAIQQIRECHALLLIESGYFVDAVAKVAHIWASLPGANYPRQRMNTIQFLQAAYIAAGGKICASPPTTNA